MYSRRWLRGVLGLVGVFAVLALGAGPARADAVGDATTALKTAAIYKDTAATIDGNPITFDQDKVTTALGTNVKVAILPPNLSTTAAADQITSGLSGNLVLAVFSGTKIDAGTNYVCRSYPLKQLQRIASAHSAELHSGDYTDTLVAFGQAMQSAPLPSSSACTGSAGGTTGVGTVSGSSGSGASVWPWLAGIGAVVVAAGAALGIRSSRRKKRELADAKANVMPYYDRLASDVNTLDPTGNAVARQALADASERYTSAGSQMATAQTVGQWAAVRRTALEGLQAARTARGALGLDPGPDLPPVDQPQGEQLTAAQQVDVQGTSYQGYPTYTPGAPYYFGGGGGYPGGWYTFPFWETLLIGSMFGGGWGFGGGGYNQGYDSGFDAGQQAGQQGSQPANDPGGWGGFGGNDGGWGGFSGGGDFGGGGGGGGSDGGSF